VVSQVTAKRTEAEVNLLEDIEHHADWIQDANCRGMDVNLFFPDNSTQYNPFAREVCMACDVIDECAWYGNETSAVYGMFGGMSPTEREVWRRKNKVRLGQSRKQWEEER